MRFARGDAETAALRHSAKHFQKSRFHQVIRFGQPQRSKPGFMLVKQVTVTSLNIQLIISDWANSRSPARMAWFVSTPVCCVKPVVGRKGGSK